MSALSSGTDDITDLSGKTIGSAASLTVTVSTYANQSVTYHKPQNAKHWILN